MAQALYRKHRPKKLSEVVGQEHITRTLETALKQGRISHAYLFTGPRGVGKTSIARILAHEINELPYTDDSAHMDIIEIDAASNRRIDEIRDLRDKVHIAPTTAKYKVYIIDEVHMLTREAFNALLKTLEEPPAHVIFILATTDAHKLPDTIVSRTQRYNFKPVEKSQVTAHLRAIASQERIDISDEALEVLAVHGEGSFRDSIGLLDQAGSQGTKITLDDVQRLLGIPPSEGIGQLLRQLQSPTDGLAGTAASLSSLLDQGFQAAAIAKQLGKKLRAHLLGGNPVLPKSETTTLLARLLDVPTSHDPERYLEIILLEATASNSVPADAPGPAPAPAAPVEAPERKQPAQTAPTPHPTVKPKPPVDGTAPVDAAVWPEVLGALKKKHNTLYGVVRMAKPSFEADGTLTLAFAFAFHQKRLNDAKHRQMLADIVEEVSGRKVHIECVVDKSVSSTPAAKLEVAPPPTDTTTLSAISNIFGGGELLE